MIAKGRIVERNRSQQDAGLVSDLEFPAGPIASRGWVLFAHLSEGAHRLFEGFFEVCDLEAFVVDEDLVLISKIEMATHP